MKEHPIGCERGKESRSGAQPCRLLVERRQDGLDVVGGVLFAAQDRRAAVEEEDPHGVIAEVDGGAAVAVQPVDLHGLVGAVERERFGDLCEDPLVDLPAVVGHADEDPNALLLCRLERGVQVLPGVRVLLVGLEPGEGQEADHRLALSDHLTQGQIRRGGSEPGVVARGVGDHLEGAQIGVRVDVVFGQRCVHEDSCACWRWHC